MAKAESESARVSDAQSDETKGRRVRRGKTGDTSRLPERLVPQLATPVEQPPAGEWRYEVKFDGYRLLARIERGEVHLLVKNCYLCA